jgi:hypothetical protein
MEAPNLHVHVYDENPEKDVNLVEEVDLVMLDEYDDYYQYGIHVQGYWVEIRVMKGE